MKKIMLFACVAMLFAACSSSTDQSNQKTPSFMDLARARYAVRNYAQTPVEQAKIDSILAAGQLAPTAKNVQPQRQSALSNLLPM